MLLEYAYMNHTTQHYIYIFTVRSSSSLRGALVIDIRQKLISCQVLGYHVWVAEVVRLCQVLLHGRFVCQSAQQLIQSHACGAVHCASGEACHTYTHVE